MLTEPTSGEQAVSRAIRDNLASLQRLGDELHQALSDLVSACASSRPVNALPPLIRAQSASASLQASLDVLARFIALSLPQQGRASSAEDLLRLAALSAPQPIFNPAPPASPPVSSPPPQPLQHDSASSFAALSEEAVLQESAAEASPAVDSPEPQFDSPAVLESSEPEPTNGSSAASIASSAAFEIAALPIVEQELHKRANRVAKVSMQDIQMLKPKDVILGRQNNDLCHRLRDDIERARREYDRRFRAILDHPVDYFYHWMVEILADGNPGALGEYPYPSPVLRHQ